LLDRAKLARLEERPDHRLDHPLDVHDRAGTVGAVRADKVLVAVAFGVASAVAELVQGRDRGLILVPIVENVVDRVEEALEGRLVGVMRGHRGLAHVVPNKQG